VSLRASISSTGGVVRGNATGSEQVSPNKRLINFSRPLAGCVPTAALARVDEHPAVDPGPGRIVVAIEGDRVAVETYNINGVPAYLPFNVIVAC
jgi:hypothetical protein